MTGVTIDSSISLQNLDIPDELFNNQELPSQANNTLSDLQQLQQQIEYSNRLYDNLSDILKTYSEKPQNLISNLRG